MIDYKKYVTEMAYNAKKAARELAILDTNKKNQVLACLAQKLEANRSAIKLENAKDMEVGKLSGLSESLLDRLLLNDKRIDSMINGIHAVAALPDPVGEVIEANTRPNGIEITKKRVPLGVIAMIYESRPNVTIEAGILCLKSGNASILRGGKEAIHSNLILGSLLQDALREQNLNPHMVQVFAITEREAVTEMLLLRDLIDIVIPRGGEGLIKFVSEHSLIPIIKHDKGVCSVFVNHDATLEMAQAIVINAKVQRPGVCNALENLYIHEEFPYIKELLGAIAREKVELRLFEKAHEYYPAGIKINDLKEFSVEYLDLILAVKLVKDMDEAVRLITEYGSGHSDAIITEGYHDARQFLSQVNSAAVYVNASTRFTDGEEFGYGAEIGISTSKLHARGPMGLRELTSYKFVIMGKGQIR
jgi:glutamate-5-semialdehyde dehydrogenase